jgi:hypothetical protein
VLVCWRNTDRFAIDITWCNHAKTPLIITESAAYSHDSNPRGQDALSSSEIESHAPTNDYVGSNTTHVLGANHESQSVLESDLIKGIRIEADLVFPLAQCAMYDFTLPCPNLALEAIRRINHWTTHDTICLGLPDE